MEYLELRPTDPNADYSLQADIYKDLLEGQALLAEIQAEMDEALIWNY
jgi:hypothetical protein